MTMRIRHIFARLTWIGLSAPAAMPDAFDRLTRMVEAERRRAGRRTLRHAR